MMEPNEALVSSRARRQRLHDTRPAVRETPLDGRCERNEIRRAYLGVTRMRSAAKLGVTLLVVFSSRAASQVSITHVNVVDVESGTVRADRTVVIQADRIRAITTSTPAGA